jgi:NAD(P)-dependent dehydrogenase (short-subunit alcohol dehydrogenase family)
MVLADFHGTKYITFNTKKPLGINSTTKQFTMQKLAGKVAIITGGSSGIGLATAKTFIEEGAYVFITGRRETELAKAKTELGKNVTTVRGDVANLSDLDRLYETIKTEKGTLDVVVANAGIVEMVPTAQVTPEHYDNTFNVNARGTFFTVQKALPLLNDGSSIVLVGSGVHTKGFPFYVTYAATKAVMRSFVRSWAADFKGRGIRVNILSPGPIDTPIIERQFKTKEEAEGMRAQFAQMVPLARLGRPEEMAKAILFLASDDSSYSTGIDLVADGGATQL